MPKDYENYISIHFSYGLIEWENTSLFPTVETVKVNETVCFLLF